MIVTLVSFCCCSPSVAGYVTCAFPLGNEFHKFMHNVVDVRLAISIQ